jgi:hypothetical protein
MTNWEQHFRRTRKSEGAQFGAFLGTHTITDLKQLVAAQDYTFSQIDGQVPKLLVPPLVLDSRVADWMADWQKLKARYADARAKAQKTIEAWSIQPDSVRSAEDEYQGILKSLDSSLANLQLNGYQKGDLQDLYNRMAEIGAHPQFPNMPQPTKTGDFDAQLSDSVNTGLLSPLADLGEGIVHPMDALKKQLLGHPIRSAAIVVGGLFALKFILASSPAGLFLKSRGL